MSVRHIDSPEFHFSCLPMNLQQLAQEVALPFEEFSAIHINSDELKINELIERILPLLDPQSKMFSVFHGFISLMRENQDEIHIKMRKKMLLGWVFAHGCDKIMHDYDKALLFFNEVLQLNERHRLDSPRIRALVNETKGMLGRTYANKAIISNYLTHENFNIFQASSNLSLSVMQGSLGAANTILELIGKNLGEKFQITHLFEIARSISGSFDFISFVLNVRGLIDIVSDELFQTASRYLYEVLSVRDFRSGDEHMRAVRAKIALLKEEENLDEIESLREMSSYYVGYKLQKQFWTLPVRLIEYPSPQRFVIPRPVALSPVSYQPSSTPNPENGASSSSRSSRQKQTPKLTYISPVPAREKRNREIFVGDSKWLLDTLQCPKESLQNKETFLALVDQKKSRLEKGVRSELSFRSDAYVRYMTKHQLWTYTQVD